MTTTIPAPITLDTACPSWCTHHQTFGGDQFQHVDFVSLRYPATKAHTSRRVFEIAAEKYVATADGESESLVYFNDLGDGTLVSMAEVEEMAAALLRAGRLAFGDR